jgi:hypothetical protein
MSEFVLKRPNRKSIVIVLTFDSGLVILKDFILWQEHTSVYGTDCTSVMLHRTINRRSRLVVRNLFGSTSFDLNFWWSWYVVDQKLVGPLHLVRMYYTTALGDTGIWCDDGLRVTGTFGWRSVRWSVPVSLAVAKRVIGQWPSRPSYWTVTCSCVYIGRFQLLLTHILNILYTNW